MNNQLIKSHKIKYTPATAGRPADPGRPYSPGGYVQQQSSNFEWMEWNAFLNRFNLSANFDGSTAGSIGAPRFKISHFFYKRVSRNLGNGVWMPAGEEKWVSFWAYSYKTVWQPEQQAIPPSPAVPASAAQTLYDFNIGWNAGARSIDAIEGLGEFEFKVSHGVAGAVVGITGKDPDTGIKSIPHAVYFNGPIAYAMTYGVAGKLLGGNQSDTVWKLKRSVDGEVTILRNNVEVHAFAEKSFGTVFLDTSLYSGGDFVYNPVAIFTGEGGGDVGPITVSGEIVSELALASGELVFPRLQAVGSDDQYCFADISLPNLVTGTWDSYGYAELPALKSGADYSTGDVALPRMKVASWGLENLPEGIPLVFPDELEPHHPVAVGLASFSLSAYGSDHKYMFANLELPSLSASGESGYAVPEHAVGGAWLQGVTMTGHMLTGTVAEGGATLNLAALGSDYAYGFGSATIGPISVMSEDGPVDEVYIGDAAAQFSDIYAQVEELIAYLLSNASATASMQLTSILTVEVSEKVEAKDVLLAIGELLAEMLAYAYGVTPLPEPEAEAFAWAATEQGGMVTRYSGYNFQSFAEINGKHYGVRADGLFLLEGADDADVPITAELNFGNMNFSRSELKHLPNVYVGAKATDGRLFLKVETTQGEFTYEARRTDERMATQRFDLGRGLRDNWFEFTLVAEDVTAFELDNVEFKPVTSKRRI